MTNRFNTIIPKKFSQTELDSRISNAQGFYVSTIPVTAISLFDAFTQLKALEAEKYILNLSHIPEILPSFDGGAALLSFRMEKPKATQKADLLKIAEETAAAYQQELANDEALAIERMTERLLIEQREALDKEHEIQLQVIRDEARKQAESILFGDQQ